MNLGAAWIYGAGPENPMRQLADKLNLTMQTTPYMCCQELYADATGTLYTKEDYMRGLAEFYQLWWTVLNASRTYEQDLSVYDTIVKVSVRRSITLVEFFQLWWTVLNASRTYEQDLSVYDTIVKVPVN